MSCLLAKPKARLRRSPIRYKVIPRTKKRNFSVGISPGMEEPSPKLFILPLRKTVSHWTSNQVLIVPESKVRSVYVMIREKSDLSMPRKTSRVESDKPREFGQKSSLNARHFSIDSGKNIFKLPHITCAHLGRQNLQFG